ncbi:Zn(II)-responsive regulator of zntA [Variovorax sp. SRS16]|uniref:Cd(II)/Pb(II)-responsive transcriptional regulator n=1 Tax=Variovorax sp. SRS16 TaxID=282217 RepID=UPI0013175BB7|nr:Cd(II)/Pb(II)-responsive transcriptional regulator [Variovorax sp. SRS16]VTU31350.1 Zn(II)-responsive regulator of zntA [Variovorax sp. SRS16]
MKIGDLALATSTPTETIRFYEREQLLAPAARTESNYRIYGDEHAAQLTFIRHCRSLDMTLDEIRVLLLFRESPQENCSGVNEVLDEHIGHVAQRIRELRALEKQLIRLRDQCSDANAAGDCGILKGLAAGVTPRASAPKGRKHVHGAH